MSRDWCPTYILDDLTSAPVACRDPLAWAEWSNRSWPTRWLAVDTFGGPFGGGVDVLVSTIFLGVNHQLGDGPPMLWETMVLGGTLDGFHTRYPSRGSAVLGHRNTVQQVQDLLGWHDA